ncbi:hypothetical protein IFM89_036740 [Coptis chinensis]|uniref:F-box domain-containing protein n=1 Tax=Coptis chinensis TaxID=261450 RepID=A0A835I7C2_9MAGN|nr:hypothetical protein IFM89_036740 [Coptis chinensis]
MAMKGISSSSCNAANKKLMTMKEEDRICCLHEPLLHHILSFMDMKEVVQTSLLSKRWRNVWRSVSVLNFDEVEWSKPRSKSKFKFFVDTVLLLRDGSDIHKFKLFFAAAHSGDSVQIERWIAYAIKRSVQVLDIAGVSIASPNLICLFGRVNTLDLGAIVLPGDENGNLILDLPILENLIIQSCDHCELISLTISGPKLKYLQLYNTFPEINYGTSIKISAPNLTSLKCKGYTYQDYTLENLSALVTAEIDTKINCKDEDADEVTTLNTLFGRCLSTILKALTNAKSLTLSAHGFQVFEELPKLLDGVPNSYQNLKYLKLIEWCDKSHIYSLAKLLEIFPHLETLVMERRKAGLKEFKVESGEEAEVYSAEVAALLASLSELRRE